MNLFILVFIMASLSIKLNAFESTGNINPKEIEELTKKIKEAQKANPDYQYKLEREEILKSDKSCIHCPKHLLLTEQINKVMEKMAKDQGKQMGNELPVKINRLKFLYYTQVLQLQDGKRICQRYLDNTLDLKPTKFDGQFQLIAEDALRFGDVSEIQYMNPELDEIVYYYRGEGGDRDIVVQAILTKDGGKFRYFRYTPSEKEKNPYNLPDLEPPVAPIAESEVKDNSFTMETIKSGNSGNSGNKDETGIGSLIGPGTMGIKFKTEVEKRNKYIPKNVHFVEAHVDHEIFGGLKVKASSDTSLKGNVANFALKNDAGGDLLLIDLDTKLNGQTEHRVRVPYSVRVFEDSQVVVRGNIQHETNAQIVTMSLTDQSIELIRSEYRRNTGNDKTSYVLARDVQINPKEILSIQYIKGEDDKKYASLKHVKSVKDNITLVLDVRVGENKQASLFYQLNAKF